MSRQRPNDNRLCWSNLNMRGMCWLTRTKATIIWGLMAGVVVGFGLMFLLADAAANLSLYLTPRWTPEGWTTHLNPLDQRRYGDGACLPHCTAGVK
jgi:hypothetical protein